MTNEQREALVIASKRYLVDIGRILDDSAAALEIFDRIGDAIDPDIKGEVLLSLLVSGSGNVIRIACGTLNRVDAVALIRAIREITHLGLKESKDIYDGLMNNPGKFYELVCLNPDLKYGYMERLRGYGLIVQ